MKLDHRRFLLLSTAVLSATLALESRASVLAISDASYSGSVAAGAPEDITGIANIVGLTTTEGTFGNLAGATASGITGGNSPQSVGYTAPLFSPSTNDPAGRAAAVTGLTINDGANNIGVGSFQFNVGAFNASTRFFIIDTTPVANTVGDNLTVTLIDALNNPVGSFTLNITADQFTNSPGGTTDTALATVTYTQNQNANFSQKLGGVTFSLEDLGVTDFSEIATATGIQISSGGLDPNVVGTFAVPEPSTYGLLIVALGLGFCGRQLKLRRKAI